MHVRFIILSTHLLTMQGDKVGWMLLEKLEERTKFEFRKACAKKQEEKLHSFFFFSSSHSVYDGTDQLLVEITFCSYGCVELRD